MHVYSAAGLRPGLRAVALLGAPEADAGEVTRALDAIERAHAAVAGQLIAEPIARGRHEGREFLALDADAAFDGERMVQTLADSGRRVPFAAAMGSLLTFCDTLARVHAAKVPPPLGPLAIGVLLPCQVLYDAEGRATLLGLGDRAVTRSAPAGVPVAPELLLGQRPDRRTDGFALAAMMRSMLAYTELPPAMARVFGGAERSSERGLGRLVRDFQSSVWSGPPRARPDPATVAKGVRLLCGVLRVEPDARAFERFIAELMAPELTPPEPTAPPTLRVADDASWFEVDAGPRCRLASRASLRRLLAALLDEHRARPGAGLEPAALLGRAWPGERVTPDSGAHRVHVAISELRKMGLRGAIERFDGGYRIAPKIDVQRVGV